MAGVQPTADAQLPPTLKAYILQTARRRIAELEGDPETRSESRKESIIDLVALLDSITLAVKKVGKQIRQTDVPAARSRDDLEMLNEFANQTWMNELLYSQKSCVIVSEDLEEPVIVEEGMQGKYAVVFDPLTGLADPPAPDMGAIFGIFYQLSGGTPGLSDVMQPARNLVAAGYCLYSSCTTLMFSVGEGLQHFTLDTSVNEFIHTMRDVKMPYSGMTYSINEGYTREYDNKTQRMLKYMKNEPSLSGVPRKCRYIGSMVADVHRTIMKGGIFIYPCRTPEFPEGRLKLLYEAGPLAFLVDQAGGHASTGTQQVIDICPTSVHTRVPVLMGSEDEVSIASGFYSESKWDLKHNDPMFALRRKVSMEKKHIRFMNGLSVDDDDDGIICCHLGVTV